MQRVEERFRVDFTVFLNWQDKSGMLRRISARCTDLSESGVMVETMDRLEPMTVVVIGSELLGRLGHASVRYCQRVKMKNRVGLKFSTPFCLGDPARRRVVVTIAHGMKLAAKMD